MNISRKADFKLAESKALEILSENFIKEPPIFPVDFVRNYGIKALAKFNGEENISGFLDVKEAKIYVNADDSFERQSFTIAHEFGHWILHKTLIEQNPAEYSVLYRKPLGKPDPNPLEQEANCFAANLLVPKNILLKYKKDLNNEQLAALFGVSQDVIGFRLRFC